jgi:hypothetical protein
MFSSRIKTLQNPLSIKVMLVFYVTQALPMCVLIISMVIPFSKNKLARLILENILCMF